MHLQTVGMQKFSDFTWIPSASTILALALVHHTSHLMKLSLRNILEGGYAHLWQANYLRQHRNSYSQKKHIAQDNNANLVIVSV